MRASLADAEASEALAVKVACLRELHRRRLLVSLGDVDRTALRRIMAKTALSEPAVQVGVHARLGSTRR